MRGVFIVLGLLLVSGCVGRNSEELMNSYSKASYKDDALGFVEGSAAYHDSGYRATCADAVNTINGDWVISCFFNSRDMGVNSTNKVVTHNVTIRYSNGKIVEATADGKYNMLGG